jgi:hypothetical protein
MRKRTTTTSRGSREIPKIRARVMSKRSRGDNNIEEECC